MTKASLISSVLYLKFGVETLFRGSRLNFGPLW